MRNNNKLRIFPTQCIYVIHMILKTNRDFTIKHSPNYYSNTVTLCSVLCEGRTEGYK